MKKRAILSWSGGKDSILALHELKKHDEIEIVSLLTTVTDVYERISMHGVRRELLALQAAGLGYALEEVRIPQDCSNEMYEQRIQHALEKYQKKGVSCAAFGDLFLEEIREYREKHLERIGLEAIFPLWGKNTAELSQQFIKQGFRAIVICVDTKALDQSFAGREYDRTFLADLPAMVDPCGENGEFHTFVYDGPMFRHRIHVERGERTMRDNRFSYCDLVDARKVSGVQAAA